MDYKFNQAEVDMIRARQKLKWSAMTPDGKTLEWYPSGVYITGDPGLSTEIENLIEFQPERLKLSYFQKLPNTVSNPYTVKLALEILYNGKEAIKYFGNVPDFKDVIVEIPESAVE
jgi:hypothetical protein